MKIHLQEINSVIIIKFYNYKILLALCSAVFHLMWNNLFVSKQPKISVYFSDSQCNYSKRSCTCFIKCSCTSFITLISTCVTVYIHLSFFSFDHISTTVLIPWSQEQAQVLPLPTSARTNIALFVYWCSSKTSWISACAPFSTAYNSCQLSHFTSHYITPSGTRSSALKETCCILKNVHQNTNVNTVFTNLNIKSRGRVRTLNGHVTVHFNLYINFAELLNLENIICFLLITGYSWVNIALLQTVF